MGKPGRDRAPGPENAGDSATRQQVCPEGPPTRTRGGRISPGPTGWPPGAERRLVPAKSDLKPQIFVPCRKRRENGSLHSAKQA